MGGHLLLGAIIGGVGMIVLFVMRADEQRAARRAERIEMDARRAEAADRQQTQRP